MGLIGRLHPVLVHFPIALILAAAAAEIAALFTRAAWRTIAIANLRAGAAMGALTAIAGWALASTSLVEPSRLLSWHRWAGMAATAMAIGAALLSRRSHAAAGPSRLVYRAALFAAAAMIAVAGHLGGTLVWGEDFLRR
jgi:uncharacterized membrane protein